MPPGKPGPLLDHYLREMADSIQRVEKSEVDYRTVVRLHDERFGEGVTSDYKAATHPELQRAVGDGAFYRSRAQMYSNAAIALILHEQHYPQGRAR